MKIIKRSIIAISFLTMMFMVPQTIVSADAPIDDFGVYIAYENCNHNVNSSHSDVLIDKYADNAVDGCHVIVSSDKEEYSFKGTLEQKGDGYSYDKKTNTLTLDNFKGQRINIEPHSKTNKKFTLVLKGNNTLKNTAVEYYALDVVRRSATPDNHMIVKGSGTLNITQKTKYMPAVNTYGLNLNEKSKVNINSTINDKYIHTLSATYLKITKDASLNINSNITGIDLGFNTESEIDGNLSVKVGKGSYIGSCPNMTIGSGKMLLMGTSESTAKKIAVIPKKSYATSTLKEYDTAQYLAVTKNTTVPKVTSSISSTKKGTVSVKWNKFSDVSGYKVYYSYSKNGGYKLLSDVKGATKTSLTKDKLISSKTVYIKVKAYKKIGDISVHSDYSDVKSVQIK